TYIYFLTLLAFTTIIPLTIFVSISMAKEGYDDIRRYRLDKAENNRYATILHAYRTLGGGTANELSEPSTMANLRHSAKLKWKDIKVGNIIKLDRDEAVPADIALLSVDNPNSIAYIETM